MKAIGRTTKLMGLADSFMQMETYTKVNGWMIKLMAKALTSILMDRDMKVNGSTINSTDKV